MVLSSAMVNTLKIDKSFFNSIGSDIFLHRDKTLMPKNPAAWSAWNFLGSAESKVCLTYWLNVLQVSKRFHL